MRSWGMRTGISFQVPPSDNRRLEVLVGNHNTA